MRFPKNVINAFAILGVVSFIVFACAAAEEAMNEDPIENNDDNDGNNDGDNNPPIQNNIGKYQVAIVNNTTNSNYITMVALNTETGVVKTYQKGNNTAWYERDDDPNYTIYLTH